MDRFLSPGMSRIRWAFKKATLAEGRGGNGEAGGWSRGISCETFMRIWEKSNQHLNLAKAQLWRQELCRASRCQTGHTLS